MKNSFFRDFLMLIGVLPIERPHKKVRQSNDSKSFLRTLSDKERKKNRLNTEKLFKLIN